LSPGLLETGRVSEIAIPRERACARLAESSEVEIHATGDAPREVLGLAAVANE
jgi:hypothetical protein